MTSTGDRRRSSIPALAGMALVLAAVAFLLVPTGQLNSRSLVRVNGVIYSVPAGSAAVSLPAVSALNARPGSQLDLTGDVTALGKGTAPTSQIDGLPLQDASLLSDGAGVVIGHGRHVLEGIAGKTESLPFETRFEGTGSIVSLVETGKPGEREVYRGIASGKQAAVFLTEAPQEAVVRRSATAKPGQKLVALTFDDGPGAHTQAVLDALAAKHVPATFFVLGSAAAGSRSLVQKIKAAGHDVENHTWSHPPLTQLNADQVRSQISRTDAVIGGSRFLRPPYGVYDADVAAIVHSMGLSLALWTVDTLDWKYPDVDSIMSFVRSETKPGAIILMHDGGRDRSATVAAIPVIVDWLFANGYSLTTVRELL